MSILESIFGGLFGNDDSSSTSSTAAEHPCSNCPSSCQLYPDACSVCQPYKEQMIDALYWVEHKDELEDQYEVVGMNGMGTGSTVCPFCGGPSNDPYICEYCGSQIQQGTGKIRVASPSDIPNPILNAQDIIFDRYNAVSGFAGADSAYGLEGALSGVNSEGLLSSIFSAILGGNSSDEAVTIGNKMTVSEIESMADYYDVSVSQYLEGLDNGKYFTLSNKDITVKAEETYVSSNTSSSTDLFGTAAGLTGALGLGSLLFGGNKYNSTAARDYRPGYSQIYAPQYNHRPDPIMPTTVNQKKVASSMRKNVSQQQKKAAEAIKKAEKKPEPQAVQKKPELQAVQKKPEPQAAQKTPEPAPMPHRPDHQGAPQAAAQTAHIVNKNDQKKSEATVIKAGEKIKINNTARTEAPDKDRQGHGQDPRRDGRDHKESQGQGGQHGPGGHGGPGGQGGPGGHGGPGGK